MSAKPNWRLRRLSSAMRRAMLAAAWRTSACASGSIALSASHKAPVASKHSGTSAAKPLLKASAMPSGVRRCQAVSLMSGISKPGSRAQARSASNHLTSESARSLLPLKHLGASERWAAIHCSMASARASQPCLRAASSACWARCTRAISPASDSSAARTEGVPSRGASTPGASSTCTRRTSSRTASLRAPTSGQQASSAVKAALLSG